MLRYFDIYWRHLRGLRWPQLGLLSLIILIGFAVTGTFYANYQQKMQDEVSTTRATLERTAQLVGARIGERVLFRNLPSIQRELRLLETVPRVGDVRVRDRSGELLVRGRIAGQELAFANVPDAPPRAPETGFTGSFPELAYTAAINLNDRTVGSITLSANGEQIEALTSRRFWWFMLESFVLWSLLAIFFVYLIVQSRFENRLRRQMQTDPVTRELSRFGLNELYADGVRYRDYAFLLIKLESLKAINSDYGITTGDRVLQIIARVARATLGNRAVIARLDGDDFAVLVPANQWALVRQISHTLLSALQTIQFDEIDDLEKISVFGGANLLATNDALSQRLSETDLAMQHARERQWQTIICADKEFIANSLSAGAFVTDLQIRQGLKQGEFDYHIQPIINVETGQTLGYECLIRWSVNGEVRSPAVFLDRFREAIKDDALYAHVVEMRRRLSHRAAKAGVGFLTYNIGLEDLHAIADSAQLRNDFGADADPAFKIVIEVTERGLPQHLGDDLTDLKLSWSNLRGSQSKLALDDFGALESNLYRLRELDIDYVKIDKALIMSVTEDSKSSAIVYAIAGLCNALNIQAIAEGIESDQQSKTVRDLGIPIQQGFFLGRPHAPDDYLE